MVKRCSLIPMYKDDFSEVHDKKPASGCNDLRISNLRLHITCWLIPRFLATTASVLKTFNWTKRLRRGMGGAGWVGCADWEEAGRREILV